MLDAHQLNVFLVAAESLNFTVAARELHMTQPSVSQHIRELERHFGTRLFLRLGRRLELTDAGEALVPLAREMSALSIRIDERMESLRGEVYGHLTIGCSTTPGRYLLPGLLASFLRRHPKVEATCQVSSRQRAQRAWWRAIRQRSRQPRSPPAYSASSSAAGCRVMSALPGPRPAAGLPETAGT